MFIPNDFGDKHKQTNDQKPASFMAIFFAVPSSKAYITTLLYAQLSGMPFIIAVDLHNHLPSMSSLVKSFLACTSIIAKQAITIRNHLVINAIFFFIMPDVVT